MLRDAKDVRRGFAHREQAAEVRGELVDVIEVEFDEAGDGGLVRRIDRDGAEEGRTRLFAGVDGRQSVCDGEEILGTKIGLVEEVSEEEVGGVDVAEAIVGDGLKTAEERHISSIPRGVRP